MFSRLLRGPCLAPGLERECGVRGMAVDEGLGCGGKGEGASPAG